MNQKGSLVKGISAEMQDCILATLIFDNEMYDLTHEIITPEFFYGDEYKTLYKALIEFHRINKANPTLKDMMIQVSLLVSNTTELLKIKALLKQLNNDYINEYYEKEESVKKTYFEEFVKRNGAEYCFSTLIEGAKSDDGVDWGKVIPKFTKYTEFTIVQTRPFCMGNTEDLHSVREESIGTDDCTKKIRFFLDEVNDLMNHHAFRPGTLNMISAPPGVGKTLTLIGQGCSATKDGFYNLHVFLGDLDRYAATLRYLSNYAKKPLSELIKMSEEEQEKLITDLNTSGDTKGALSRNYVVALPAGVLNVQSVCNEILKVQIKNGIHFNQIIIDYDANILPTNDNMYDSGGEIYNYLREFAIKNKTVLFVASQPKVSFFTQEVLTLDSASESTKKQHICDTMITLGRGSTHTNTIATMYIPKNRDGIANKKIRLYIDGSKQTVQPISEDEYERLKRDAASE